MENDKTYPGNRTKEQWEYWLFEKERRKEQNAKMQKECLEHPLSKIFDQILPQLRECDRKGNNMEYVFHWWCEGNNL